MSRTDKDMPFRVRATRWQEQHYRCSFARFGRTRDGHRECDLPDWPPSRANLKFPGVWHTFQHCAWVPDLGSIYPDRLNPFPAPPKWFVDHIGHNMERRRKRDECIAARKEYRATGEVDIVPTVLQHRHQAIWLYW
jgi:hypothetical protein